MCPILHPFCLCLFSGPQGIGMLLLLHRIFIIFSLFVIAFGYFWLCTSQQHYAGDGISYAFHIKMYQVTKTSVSFTWKDNVMLYSCFRFLWRRVEMWCHCMFWEYDLRHVMVQCNFIIWYTKNKRDTMTGNTFGHTST